MQEETEALLQSYYAAFNAQDTNAVLALLSNDIIHDIGQGRREFGKSAFGRFMESMSQCCQEHIFDIEVMTNENGSRAAAEFTIIGSYGTGRSDSLPEPGQTFRVPGGTFFEIRNGKITRISSYYGLQEWLAQIIFTESQTYAETESDEDPPDFEIVQRKLYLI
jgi:steroid delta-isomerase-like uncharacterized protein